MGAEGLSKGTDLLLSADQVDTVVELSKSNIHMLGVHSIAIERQSVPKLEQIQEMTKLMEFGPWLDEGFERKGRACEPEARTGHWSGQVHWFAQGVSTES